MFDKRARRRRPRLPARPRRPTFPKVVLARARAGSGRSYRPSQNVELNAFFEQRGNQASWAVLIGYYVLAAVRDRRARRDATAPDPDLPDHRDHRGGHAHRGRSASRSPATAPRSTPSRTVLAAVAIDALWRRWRAPRPRRRRCGPAREARVAARAGRSAPGRGRRVTTTSSSPTAPHAGRRGADAGGGDTTPGRRARRRSERARTSPPRSSGVGGARPARPADERVLVAAHDRPGRLPRVPAVGRRVLLPPPGEHCSPTASSSSTPSSTCSTVASRCRAPATRRCTPRTSRCGRSIGIDGVTAHRVASCLLGVATIVVVGLVGKRIAGPAVGLIAATVIGDLPVHVDQRRHADVGVDGGARAPRSSCSPRTTFSASPDTRHAVLLGLACGAGDADPHRARAAVPPPRAPARAVRPLARAARPREARRGRGRGRRGRHRARGSPSTWCGSRSRCC